MINYASNASRAEQVVEELEKLSPIPKQEGTKNFSSIRADLSKRDDIIRLVSEATAEMGKLDVLFSNGGWTMIRNFRDLDDNMNEDDWDKCFNMNVKSHLWLMHAARKWLDESEGVFITTASLAGVRPSGSSLVRFLITMGRPRLMRAGLLCDQSSTDSPSKRVSHNCQPSNPCQLRLARITPHGPSIFDLSRALTSCCPLLNFGLIICRNGDCNSHRSVWMPRKPKRS